MPIFYQTRRRSSLIALVAALAIAGCSRPSPGFVRVEKGKGTAEIAGVTFEVDKPGGGGAKYTEPVEGQKQQRHKIKLGEVDIVLSRSGDGPWKLTVNETSYGTVKSGDKVKVDETRGVLVNDNPRSPAKSRT
jgi:hypothetical protein